MEGKGRAVGCCGLLHTLKPPFVNRPLFARGEIHQKKSGRRNLKSELFGGGLIENFRPELDSVGERGASERSYLYLRGGSLVREGKRFSGLKKGEKSKKNGSRHLLSSPQARGHYVHTRGDKKSRLTTNSPFAQCHSALHTSGISPKIIFSRRRSKAVWISEVEAENL